MSELRYVRMQMVRQADNIDGHWVVTLEPEETIVSATHEGLTAWIYIEGPEPPEDTRVGAK